MRRGRVKRLAGRASAAVRRAVIPPSQPTERNIHFLYVEIVFASILSAAASFNGTYVLRLGGSNALVGLLSSIPALLAVFTYLPSARFLERQTNQMPWVVRSLFLARLGYLFLPILPFFMGRYVAEATVAVLVSMQVPAVFFSTAWSPLLSDVVPPRQRGNVLAWRSILSSGAIAPLIFLAGRWLDAVTFPGNYQWLYVAGVLGGWPPPIWWRASGRRRPLRRKGSPRRRPSPRPNPRLPPGGPGGRTCAGSWPRSPAFGASW